MNNTTFKGSYVLITGSSHGIGKEMAKACAELGFNLLLVALPDELLENTAKELKEGYGVCVDYFGVDLTDPEGVIKVYQWFKSKNIPLKFLINNAGMGSSGWFGNAPDDHYRSMIRLNNEATVMMSKYFLPELKANPQSFLLNVGSMESFFPLPYKVVYTGTKQFLYGFTLALREELRRDKVSVSLLCPGPVPTHEESRKRIERQGAKSKLIIKMPEEVAFKAVHETLRGKNVIVPGRINKASELFSRIWPTAWKLRILERIFRVYVKED